MRYIDLIRAVKAVPDGFYITSWTGDLEEIVYRLRRCNRLKLEWIEGKGQKISAIIPDPTPQPAVIAPNPRQIATPVRVQVQWWHNATLHAGERFGQFSQDTYEVLSQDEKWTAIRFHGKKHTVATSRVRVAA